MSKDFRVIEGGLRRLKGEFRERSIISRAKSGDDETDAAGSTQSTQTSFAVLTVGASLLTFVAVWHLAG